MKRIHLNQDLSISQFVHGHWRLMDWNLSEIQLQNLIESLLALGITTMDHADIYGDYQCEKEFGKMLKNAPHIRKSLEIVTKCGIILPGKLYPNTPINYYNTSQHHIIKSVERSLSNLNTEYIDLLLIHRPDPMMDHQQVNAAFNHLLETGKVKNFGVSNFTAAQFSNLNKALEVELITNQLELSPYCLDHFENNNLDYLTANQISPMAWSPFSGGQIFTPQDDKGIRLKSTLESVGASIGASGMDQTILTWLLAHPSNMACILGTGKLERIKSALESCQLEMNAQQWFEIFVASKGERMP